MQHSALWTIAVLILAIYALMFDPRIEEKQVDKQIKVSVDSLIGAPIMGKMANQTARAELGRAFWHVFHTVASSYPERASREQATILRDWVYLTARLYPCGECAEHFQKMLKVEPPVVNGHEGVAMWACRVHNLVNKHLGKPQFDCSIDVLDQRWQCGCAT
jgi:FAD-linked sulfhydryl oxidase